MAELYSVKQGEIVDWDLSVDQNGEIVAETGSVKDGSYEALKFPAGLTKKELARLFKLHNDHNDGKVALPEDEQDGQNLAAEASQKLLDSL